MAAEASWVWSAQATGWVPGREPPLLCALATGGDSLYIGFVCYFIHEHVYIYLCVEETLTVSDTTLDFFGSSLAYRWV